MQPNFTNLVDFMSTFFFDGSSTLAGLALLIGAWAICAVICMNAKANPAYTVVPMIPLAIFFAAYGILSETIMVMIVLVASVLVAAEFKKVVD